MAEQEQIKKPSAAKDAVEVDEATSSAGPGAEQLKADLDDLLDEIDGVLEDNAEEFVRNYVQKGGE